MKKCIINGKILLQDKILVNYVVIFDEKIEKILPADEVNLSAYEVIDAEENFVSPGFIDMHIHGYLGKDASDGDVDGIKVMAEGIIKNGVTSWCPTTMTVSKKEIENAFDTVRSVKNSGEYYGAKIIGVNSEGPFINANKKGAQAEEHILKPDADFIIRNSDIVKLFTVAPEVDGAIECIKKVAKSKGMLISMGHTDANFDEAKKGIDCGVRHTTHLFNAMTALTHRSPGVVGAALSDSKVSVELIADTFHVNKGIFNLVAKLKEDKLCLITDCIRAGGMPDGDYTLGGQPVHKEGIKCLMNDGTIAGSVLNLNDAVYNLYQNAELEFFEAVNCASLNPATALGVDDKIGSIKEGKCADLIIFDENIKVKMTIVDGKIRYKGE